MDKKQKAKFQSEWKKPGNVKKNEIINPGSVVRGVAKVAAKVAKKQTAKKIVKTTAKAKESAKTAKIASNSVKTRPEDKIKRLRDNVDSYYKTVKAKSGATAKQDAAEAAKTNYRNSPYKENQVVRVKSAYVKPYKITGGAGSTARRKNEITDTRKLKKK
jgi:D-arabinose 1-dehydrogenase-like Zn-dependent alcohol dehydrogenase